MSGFDNSNHEPVVGHTMLSTLPSIGATASANTGSRKTKIANSHSSKPGSYTTMQAKKGEAYVAKGSMKGSYGPINAEGKGRLLGASARNTTGDGALYAAVSLGVETSVAQGEIKSAVGTEDYNVFGGGKGSLGKAHADVDAGFFTGEGGDVGVKGKFNLGVYTAEGSLFAGFDFPGVKGTASVGGSVLSAHIGGGFDGTINDKTGVLTISGFEHLGFGVGEKTSFKVEIDLVKMADAVYNLFK